MKPDEFPIVPGPTRDRLNSRQLVEYTEHRKRLISWMLSVGKNPERGEGYSPETIERRSYYTDIFYRWVWDQRDYTTHVTQQDADDYIRHLVHRDVSDSVKSKYTKSIKMLFRWRAFEFNEDCAEWDPPVTFYDAGAPATPRDYLTRSERRKIARAALEYGSVPHYNALDPDERMMWKTHLSRRFDKPVTRITKEDFERANSFKIPSLVWVSLDTGLRPIEVARATVRWVDVENALLRIPAEESSKNREHWHVSIREETAEFLNRWLEERELYDKYDGTDAIWLTRHSNPYRSTALKYVLHKLCDLADIETDNRQMTWYAIRHSVGTYMSREEGLAAAKAQLRHKKIETTEKYDQAPTEDRRSALNRMG